MNTCCIVRLFNPVELWSTAWSVGQFRCILRVKWTMETFGEIQ